MKAGRLFEAKAGLQVEEIPIPELGDEDVLIKVMAAGICGTDVHIAIEGTVQPAVKPITLGHEASGVIFKTGTRVKEWKEGERVLIYPHIPCGECKPCQEGRESLCLRARIFGLHIDGAFAEFIKVHQRCLISLPGNISFEEGAIIPDAVSTPFHAIVIRGGIKSGDKVAIFGCGGLGIHGIKIAKAFGASMVIAVDVSDGALGNAKNAGADEIINSSKTDPVKRIRDLTGKEGVALSFEFVGNPQTVEQAMKCLKMGGRAVVAGISDKRIEIPQMRIFVGCEFELFGSMGSTRDDVKEVINLISSKQLDISTSITKKIRLEEVNTGLEDLYKRRGDPVRIVITV